jgi:hypothetical protein
MASMEWGATQLFLLSGGTTARNDDKGTTLVFAFLASPPASLRDDVALGTSLGTPRVCPVPTVRVVYTMLDRALCRCFARNK